MIAQRAAGDAALKCSFVDFSPVFCVLAYMALLDLQQ